MKTPPPQQQRARDRCAPRAATACVIATVALGWLGCSTPDPHAATTRPTAGASAVDDDNLVNTATAPPDDEAWSDPGWTVQPSPEGGLAIGYSHTPLLTAKHVAFGRNWAWGGLKLSLGPERDGTYTFAGRSTTLPLRVQGSLRRDGDRLTLEYTLDVDTPIDDAVGVGIEFEVALGSTAWPQTAELSPPGATGFEIAVGSSAQIRVGGGSNVTAVRERARPGRIRIFAASGDIPAGRYPVSMTVDLPAGTRSLPPARERYDAADRQRWHPQTLLWDDWPVDLSYLNAPHRPAGKHGQLTATGDALQWSDGSPARFWGTNISARTLFDGDKDAIALQAKRLAALGYNLVRLHHHDARWIPRNVFDTRAGTTQTLAAEQLDQLDWWLHCLANEGIYVWLDVHVSRAFLAGDDIPGQAELDATFEGRAVGFSYVNPRIEALLAKFTKQYVGRKSAYRGKPWAEDPAVVAILVTNENDLTDHFGNLFNQDKAKALPVHRRLFEGRATPIVQALGLDPKAAAALWKPGPGKILLAELQHQFDVRALATLRDLGAKAPIATTSYWGRSKLYSLPPLAYADLIDVHSYGEEGSLAADPRHTANWIHFIAAASVENKPVSVSEWNVPSPTPDRFVAPLYIAAVGSLQGWDALTSFAYSQAPVGAPTRTGPWEISVDPSLMALTPAAAIMFRRGDVRPANETVVVAPGYDQVWGQARNAENSATLRTLPEQTRMVLRLPDAPELSWDTPGPGSGQGEIVTNLDEDFVGATAGRIESDTGELRRDFARGTQTIDTPNSAAATGWIGGRRIELGDVFFEVETASAAAVLTSLDGEPLSKSRKILVTAVARAEPDPTAPGGYRAEPVAGRFGVRNSGKLRQFALSSRSRATGAPRDRVPQHPRQDRGWQVFEFPTGLATHWTILTAE